MERSCVGVSALTLFPTRFGTAGLSLTTIVAAYKVRRTHSPAFVSAFLASCRYTALCISHKRKFTSERLRPAPANARDGANDVLAHARGEWFRRSPSKIRCGDRTYILISRCIEKVQGVCRQRLSSSRAFVVSIGEGSYNMPQYFHLDKSAQEVKVTDRAKDTETWVRKMSHPQHRPQIHTG